MGARLAGARLVRLAGPGGVGTSRLAADVAGDLRTGFPGGTRMSEAQHIHIRFPAPRTAVMITFGNCVLRDGATQCRTEDLSQQTPVALQTDEGWPFTSFHNSRVRLRL